MTRRVWVGLAAVVAGLVAAAFAWQAARQWLSGTPLERSRSAYDRGDWGQSATLAGRWLERHPDDRDAIRLRARGLARLGRGREAIPLFARLGAERLGAEDLMLIGRELTRQRPDRPRRGRARRRLEDRPESPRDGRGPGGGAIRRGDLRRRRSSRPTGSPRSPPGLAWRSWSSAWRRSTTRAATGDRDDSPGSSATTGPHSSRSTAPPPRGSCSPGPCSRTGGPPRPGPGSNASRIGTTPRRTGS